MEQAPDALLCAYAAGFIDGEGCLAITGSRKSNGKAVYYVALMVVVQTDLIPLCELQAAFGGFIHTGRRTVSPSGKPKRIAYQWHLSGKRLRVCLQAIRPYLRVKAAQADRLLEFFEVLDETKVRYGRGGTPDDAEARRRSYYERLKQMRASGPANEPHADSQSTFTESATSCTRTARDQVVEASAPTEGLV
jgi:hypothetical protein